jgi:uridine kinase
MPPARVVLLAGPSGSGKTYVAQRTGLPVLCLDDFYRDGDDPMVPRLHGKLDWDSPLASNPDWDSPLASNPDWDSPLAWNPDEALAAIESLCRQGEAETPFYAIGADRRIGRRWVRLDGSSLFVAEGIFAAEIVAQCQARGLLAGAYALRRPRVVTYLRRLTRDLAEHRKPAGTLIRRGYALLRAEPEIFGRQVLLGAQPASPRAVLAAVARLGELSGPGAWRRLA